MLRCSSIPPGPAFFQSAHGPRWLGGLVLVAVRADDRVVGFVAGATNVRALFRRVLLPKMTMLLLEACRRRGLNAEWIYTGQTGWMQGARYGFVFDAVVNDYVSGEVEVRFPSAQSVPRTAIRGART